MCAKKATVAGAGLVLLVATMLASGAMNPTTAFAQSPMEDAQLGGIWDLGADIVVSYPPQYSCSFLDHIGDPHIPVNQSDGQIYADDVDLNSMPFILQGTIDGNSVVFTITGFGITPGDGGCSLASRNHSTTYSGEFDASTNTIQGSVSGSAEYSFEFDDQGNHIWQTVTWTGTFIVTIERPLPVLLVHGYCDSAGMWGPDRWPYGGPFNFEEALEDEGFSVETIDLIPKPTNDSIWNYGSQLFGKIMEMKDRYHIEQVDIVAHSLGGLAARAYAWQNSSRRDVRTLIMLGTPNNGTRLAEPRFWPILRAWLMLNYPLNPDAQPGEAAVQMRPGSPFLRDLNGAGLQPSIENYYTIAGSKEIYPLSLFLNKEPNDGVVQVPSVQVLTYATHIEAAVDHSHYDDDAYVFDTVVNILRGTSSSASPNFEIQQSGTDYQESALIEDTVTIGEENHHSIPIDSTVSEVHFIMASDEGELDFTLTSPGGTLITPTVAAGNPLITYTNAITTLIGYNITSPEHGNWTAHVAISGTVASEVGYAMLTLFDSELGLSILLDEDVYQTNDSVPLTAGLMNGSNPIIGATVTAQVVSPSGSTEVLSLYDDGSHGDAQASDGIYTNLYTDTTATGAYEVTVTASGTIYDEPFVRETATTIWVECVVTTTADSGPGSLRQCMLDAQSGETITFDPAVFPPGSPVTITLTSGPLPDITQGGLMIDGSNAGVILDGSALSSGDGVHITSDGNVIRGLQVLHFPGSGIQIDGGASHNLIGGSSATPGGTCSGDCNLISGNAGNGVSITGGGTIGNTVGGNYIGTNISGTAVISNTGDGVNIGDGAQYNTIADNLISGNGWMGVCIAGTDTMSNTVKGNLIGVDVNGTADLGNAKHGVLMQSGAQGNVIGGATSGERNIISANHDGSGIRIEHVDTIGNVVIGNFIGTDVNGTVALGNAHGGVSIDWGAQQNRIGGTTIGGRNLISGNEGNGVNISGSGTISNTVSGNYIGTEVNGTTGLGNAWAGVDIRGGAQANTVGGRTAGERNIISSNGFVGVGIWDAGTDNNVVIGNYVGTDVNGTAELGNESAGVRLGHGSEHNIVGGATSGERNIISGNGRGGVEIGGAHNNLIIGNFIGTDVNGTAALSNLEWGIIINDAGQSMATTLNVIERNLISGNECNGIDLYGANTVSNTVRGNLIGTDAAGTGALGNGCQGIWFGGGAHHNTIGGSTVQDRNIISGNNWGVGIEGVGTTNNTVTGNLIGTDISGAEALGNNNAGVVFYNGSQRNIIGPENTVAYNSTDGILVYGSTCLGNTITQNSIHGNARLGIELENGGNTELAAPVITAFDLGAGTVTGTACAYCTVEVFSDSTYQGEVYEGQTTADGAGDFTFTKGASLIGPHLTATATDADGDTSQFSDPAPPVNTPPILSSLPNQIFDHTTTPPGTFDLWAYAWDAQTPVDVLTYTIEGPPPAGAGVWLEGNRTVHASPSPNWCGGTDVTVRATDPGGLWDEDTFRVAVSWSCPGPVEMPGAPVLIAPVDGRTAHSDVPAFAWHPVEGAERYRIQVDDEADKKHPAGFSSPEGDEVVASTDYTPAAGLSGGVYTWRVRAVNGSEVVAGREVGAWSPGWAFAVPTLSPPGFKLYLPVVAREYP